MSARPSPGSAVAAVLLAASATPGLAEGGSAEGGIVISGQATVIDGDTLVVGDRRVRLWGIDAPERDQVCEDEAGGAWPCGEEAAIALDAFIDDRRVQCYWLYDDRFGRAVATCRRDGVDIGGWLVREGWALDWPRYSGGAYAKTQEEAQRDGEGLWRGTFVPPWDWRK